MWHAVILAASLAAAPFATTGQPAGAVEIIDLVDHHMHPRYRSLPEEVVAACKARGDEVCAASAGFDESGLIGQMDADGVAKAVLVSSAHLAGLHPPDQPTPSADEVTAAVRARNERAARAAGAFPDRLVGFLSVDPLHSSAIPEILHWGSRGGLAGVKMQLSAAGFDFGNAGHIAKLRQVFETAHQQNFALLVHLRPDDAFGAEEVRIFVDQILPAAPGTPVQIAHLGGWGSGYDEGTRAALETFADFIAAGDPRMRMVQFDMSAAVQLNTTKEQGALLAESLRRAGLERFLFASDYPGFTPALMWAVIRSKVPLTDEEFLQLRRNRAHYLR